MDKIKGLLLKVWIHIPFGYICKFKYGNDEITLHKNAWVSIYGGGSVDMLPLTLVSQELIDECEKQMRMRGYTE